VPKCECDRCSLVTSGTLETGGWIAIETFRALTEDLGGTHHAKEEKRRADRSARARTACLSLRTLSQARRSHRGFSGREKPSSINRSYSEVVYVRA
jgi:hypothetical protein